MRRSYAEACADELKGFVGLTVAAVVIDKEEGFVGLEFGEKVVWFLSDPEGNGPGFPEVEDKR